MPSGLYAPGKSPPPHLSPFVDNEAEGYTPEFAHTIKQLQVGRTGGWGWKCDCLGVAECAASAEDVTTAVLHPCILLNA
jgi:hypothetical protein